MGLTRGIKPEPSYSSPNVFSFNNYINHPSVNSTGSLTTSLPIYDLKDRDIQLNISLNYDHSGIKVDSRASWVGTGWNLSAGGVITREVRDLPDDAFYEVEHFRSGIRWQVYFGWLLIPYEADENEGRIYEFDPNEEPTPLNPAGQFVDYLEGRNDNLTKDKEPDIYRVYLNGDSFSFVFTEEREPKIIGLSDYKIEFEHDPETRIPESGNTLEMGESKRITDHLQKFIITSPTGYKYEFEEKEFTRTDSKNYSFFFENVNTGNRYLDNITELITHLPEHPTAWYLTRISSPLGSIATISYQNRQVSETPPITKYMGFCEDGDCMDDDNRNKFDLLYDMEEAEGFNIAPEYFMTLKFIDEINTDNYKIKFKTANDRLDYENTPELNEIEIISKLNNDEVIESFTFFYSYQNSDCSDSHEIEWCKRLFLEGVDAKSNPTDRLYDFSYNEIIIPRRFSYEQDFWGYFNNSDAQSLIPALWVYPDESGIDLYRIYENPNKTGLYLPGADRSVNPTYAQAGTLTSIKFNTGGSRSFEYESHDYYDGVSSTNQLSGGLRIKSITHDDGEQEVTRSYEYSKFANPSESSGLIISSPIYAEEIGYFFCRGVRYDNYWPPEGGVCIIDASSNMEEWERTEYSDWDRFTKRSTRPYNSTNDIYGNSIYYSEIKEKEAGYIKYEFYSPITAYTNASNILEDFIFGPNYSSPEFDDIGGANTCVPLEEMSWTNVRRGGGTNKIPYPPLDYSSAMGFISGKIRSKSFYTIHDNKVKEIIYSYSPLITDGTSVYGFKHGSLGVFCPIFYLMSDKKPINWSKYEIKTGSGMVLKDIKTFTYDLQNNENIQQTEVFNYSSRYSFPNEKIVIGSNDKVFKTIYQYPLDFKEGLDLDDSDEGDNQSKAIKAMIDNNIISYPIETINLANNKIVGANLRQFKVELSNIVLAENYKLIIPQPIEYNESFKASVDKELLPTAQENYNYTFLKDNRYVLEESFLEYDSFGNLLKYKNRAGIEKHFQWEYNQSLLTEIRINPNTDLESITKIIHKPLIGITEIEDSNGTKKFFKYDDFNRLRSVEDYNGNIITAYDYFLINPEN